MENLTLQQLMKSSSEALTPYIHYTLYLLSGYFFQDSLKVKKCEHRKRNSARDGIRTQDLWISSHAFYPWTTS